MPDLHVYHPPCCQQTESGFSLVGGNAPLMMLPTILRQSATMIAVSIWSCFKSPQGCSVAEGCCGRQIDLTWANQSYGTVRSAELRAEIMSKNSVTKNTVKLFLVLCFDLERSVKTRQTSFLREQGLNLGRNQTGGKVLVGESTTAAILS